MQEVFEKIKERLKNELHLAKEDGERYLKGNSNQFLYARARGYEVAMENANEIVNQVAEEYVGKTDKFGNTERVNKHLDSLHEKILKSKFAEEVTEVEIDALVKAKNLNKFNQELNKPMIEHDGCKGCKYEHETSHSQHCQYCTQNAVDKYTKKTNADKIRNMTDEELAYFLYGHANCESCNISEKCNMSSLTDCEDVFLEWLQQEVEE